MCASTEIVVRFLANGFRLRSLCARILRSRSDDQPARTTPLRPPHPSLPHLTLPFLTIAIASIPRNVRHAIPIEP
jgi:hypothetical protein